MLFLIGDNPKTQITETVKELVHPEYDKCGKQLD